MSGAVFVSGVGPWCSAVIRFVSTLSPMAILARFDRYAEVQRSALLAVLVAAAGAVLGLLVVLVPYLVASPPIGQAFAATIGTPYWLWLAGIAVVVWVWRLVRSIWTLQQGPASTTACRERTVSHG